MMEKTLYLQLQREKRLAALVGKFVVIADNTNANADSSILYLQDPKIPTRSRYNTRWTRFLVNALAFQTAQEARDAAAKYRFNNPRVAQI